MLLDMEGKGLVQGIELQKGEILITHMFFADDILIFMKINKQTPGRLKDTFESFCEISAQKINDGKSTMMVSPNFEVEEREGLQEKFKIQIKAKIGKYLGTYIDPGIKMKEIGNQILDQIQSKLQNSSGKLRYQSSKLTLIKFIMQAMSIYSMSVHQLPMNTCNSIDKIIREFWWGDNLEKR